MVQASSIVVRGERLFEIDLDVSDERLQPIVKRPAKSFQPLGMSLDIRLEEVEKGPECRIGLVPHLGTVVW